MSSGYVLDSGAFIAVEKGNTRAGLLIDSLRRRKISLITSAGVVAQVWRGGNPRQVPLAFLLAHVEVVDLTNEVAKTLGLMLKLSKTNDPIDAHVAYLANLHNWPVITSDPGDIRAINPTVTVEVL